MINPSVHPVLEWKLQHLEDLDLSKQTVEDIENIVVSLSQELERLGENKAYYEERLGRFSDFANSHFVRKEIIANIKSVDFNQPKRGYAGFCEKSKFIVNLVFDHLFLSRVYHEQGSNRKIKLDWRFNREGRIDIVDSRIHPEDKIDHIAIKADYKSPPLDWNKGVFIKGEIPSRSYLVARDFLLSELKYQFLSILRFGHYNTRLIVNCFIGDRIKDSLPLKEDQKQLREIGQDPAAMQILLKASFLCPYIDSEREGDFTVRYSELNRLRMTL